MIRRWIAVLLALCLCAGLVSTVFAANSYDGSVNVDLLIEAGKQMYSSHEGHYDSIVASDSGAVGMGILGWRGPKALQLLKMICKADPSLSLSLLGDALYNEIVTASDTLVSWNYRVFTSDEVARTKVLLGTNVSIQAQETLAADDIKIQINYAWQAGIRSDAAILYYCSVENHYGHGGALKFMRSIRATLGITTEDTINSLEELHGAVVKAAETYSNVKSTLAYRTKIYNFIKYTLKWDTTGQPAPGPLSGFTDVAGHWALDGIEYAVTRGMFKGTSETTFSPDAPMTRAMLVTVLYRVSGSPGAQTVCTFSDVPQNEYYTAAVNWASENGIVLGVSNESFDPDSSITREQIATILYRFSEYKNNTGFVKSSALRGFGDINNVSDYARVAMIWAIDRGIIRGDSGMLYPEANATRAEVAVMLMRFCQG